MTETTKIINNSLETLWQVSCGEWTSTLYSIRTEAMRTKRTLDVGNCKCKNHDPYPIKP